MKKLSFILVFCLICGKSLAQYDRLSVKDSLNILKCFTYVNDYMDEDNYDSSQYWLDKIDNLLPIKKVTRLTYLFHSRQSEIYYYNNLMQLGIEEANRGYLVAKALNDSTLISDAYNFLGLFYLNLGELDSAEHYLSRALKFDRNDKTQIAEYFNLTQKYHIYGNLGETYMNKKDYYKAYACTDSSIVYAIKKKKYRAIALGEYTKGDILLRQQKYNEALGLYKKSQNTSLNSPDFINNRDAYLVCFSGIAKCNMGLGNIRLAKNNLNDGLQFYKNQEDINRYFSLIFIDDAIEILTELNDYKNLAEYLRLKSDIENQNVKGSLKKIQTIIDVSLRNERKLMNLQVNEAKLIQEKDEASKKNKLMIFILVSFIIVLLLWIIRRLFKENKSLVLKNKEISEAMLKGQTIERKRVAMDLHDNIGSTLSALWISFGAIDGSNMTAKEKEILAYLKQNIEKAYNDVRILSHNLLPAEFEKQGLQNALTSFIENLNRNSFIKFKLFVKNDFGRISNKIEFELYSICLELANNIMKHSKATEAIIELSRNERQIMLTVSDNGIGVFKNDSDGKGMKNVKARVDSLNGFWNIDSKENEGTNSQINIPI